MKLRLKGIALDTGRGINKADFFAEVERAAGRLEDYRGHKRRLIVDRASNCYLGVLLTFKGHRKYLSTSSETAPSLRVTPKDLQGKAVHMNLFAIHRQSGRGLYQHYRGSCSVQDFGGMMKRRYRQLQKRLIEYYVESNGSPSARKKAAKRFRGPFELSEIIDIESLSQAIKRLESIDGLQVDFREISEEQVPSLLPLSPYVRSQRVVLRFDKELRSPSTLRREILKLARLESVDKGRVIGREDGDKRMFEFIGNTKHFGEFDHDASLAHDLDTGKLSSFPLMKRMLHIIRSHKSQFQLPTRS